jgi:hypothetical protein
VEFRHILSVWNDLLVSAAGMSASMRFIHAAAAVAMVITALFLAPGVLLGAPSAHADYAGYQRCAGKISEIPLAEPDPKNMYLAGVIEQDLKSGVSPAAEGQKVARMGFDPRVAGAVVQCVAQNSP